MAKKDIWDFKCIGIDNQLLPMAGISWESSEFNAVTAWDLYGPPIHPPPNKPLPPLPTNRTLPKPVSTRTKCSNTDASPKAICQENYDETCKFSVENRQGLVTERARPLLPMLVDVLDGVRDIDSTSTLVNSQRFTSITDGSGSITIGLDETMAQMPNPLHVQGTVLHPTTYGNIPEAYDDEFEPCTHDQLIGLLGLFPLTTNDEAPQPSTQQTAVEHKLSLENKAKMEILQQIQKRTVDDQLHQIPDKAARILGMHESIPKKRRILFLRGS